MQPKTWKLKKQLKNKITYLGRVNFRNDNRRFGIKENDRFSHLYAIGKTGVGKTTLLKSMILQDIENGNGCAVFDPHGDLVEDIVSKVPDHRKDDLVYLDIPDPDLKLGFNPLKKVSYEKRVLVASGLLETFKKHFGEKAWGVGMEHILRNCLLTLLDQDKADIGDILRLLNEKDYRSKCVRNIQNSSVRNFWEQEYNKYPPFTRQAAIRPIQNKIGAYMSNPVAKRLLVENQEDISLRKTMDERKILIINLAKGKIGEDAASLLGSLTLTSLGLAAFSRQDIPEYKRVPFFIYADEFQNFTTSFLVNAFSELRKFKIGIMIANQYLGQIQRDIRDAVFGNIGSLIVFRVGIEDAKKLCSEFSEQFSFLAISSQSNFFFKIKMSIDGQQAKTFSGK